MKVDELLYTNAIRTTTWPKPGVRVPGTVCVARYAGQATRIMVGDANGRPLIVFEVPDDAADVLTRFISEAVSAGGEQ